MALKRFTDNAQTPEKKRVAIPLTSSADNTDYYATGADMAEIVLNNTSRLWDLKATVLPTCRSFRDREYLKAGSWFFEDISNTEDKPDKLKEKNVQFARLLCEEGQSAQEGLKFVKQYLFYVNMTDNELELSMRGLLLNGGGEVQGATPWKTGVDEADVAKEAINAKSADIATSVIDNVENVSGQKIATTEDTVDNALSLGGFLAKTYENYTSTLETRDTFKLNQDLNDIKTPGIRYTKEANIIKSLKNLPKEIQGLETPFIFKCYVDESVPLGQTLQPHYHQEIVKLVTYEKWTRDFCPYYSSAWSDWEKNTVDSSVPLNAFNYAAKEGDNVNDFKLGMTGVYGLELDNAPYNDRFYSVYTRRAIPHETNKLIQIAFPRNSLNIKIRYSATFTNWSAWQELATVATTTLQAYNQGITKEVTE